MSLRRAGVLAHLSSVPGARLVDACRFVDFVAEAGFSIWQMLPVTPSADGSPYAALSSFAGEPALLADAAEPTPAQLEAFRSANEAWLEDYALFVYLRRQRPESGWTNWPAPLRDREPVALAAARREAADALAHIRREQCRFALAFDVLREHAAARGVQLFGDVPFFVSLDSADVWTRQTLFRLGRGAAPREVAGVPPDYFSPTGQRWGNPLYDWDAMRADAFAWWNARLAAAFARFDLVRIDHFRALAASWAIPEESPTAEKGRWIGAPGDELLSLWSRRFGLSRFVAEDLGTITADVAALRRRWWIPGMRILQFGFDGDPANPHLPANHDALSVAYTGTHDNDTTLGWFESLDDRTRAAVQATFPYPELDMPARAVRTCLDSPARLAVVPMQDLLGLGSAHRMNTPGTLTGNWQWRFEWSWIAADIAARTRAMIEASGRLARHRPDVPSGGGATGSGRGGEDEPSQRRHV